jgi:hypothetical protein
VVGRFAGGQWAQQHNRRRFFCPFDLLCERPTMPQLHIEFMSTRPSASPASPPLSLSLPTLRASLRELIARAVREERQRLCLQQSLHQSDAALRTARQYLSDDEVQALATEGRVALAPALDADAASTMDELDLDVRAAWQAFERQRFLVTVGDERIHDLDHVLDIGLDRVVRFVRLIPLQGG